MEREEVLSDIPSHSVMTRVLLLLHSSMTHICLSLSAICNYVNLLSIYLTLNISLLFWPTHPSHLECYLLGECFICISLLAFICPFFHSTARFFNLFCVFSFLELLSTKLVPSSHGAQHYTCKSLCLVLFAMTYLLNLTTIWEQSSGNVTLVVFLYYGAHLFAITCFPPAVITSIKLHLLLSLLFQA